MDLATLSALAVRVLLVVAMAEIGMRLGRAEPSTVVLDPLVLARLAIVNLVVVPLVGLATCLVTALDPPVAMALLVLAAAPAASLTPKLVEVAGGDLAVGVVATFALAVATTVTLAPTLAALTAAAGLPAEVAAVDTWPIVMSLAVFQLAPLVIGLVIGRRRPVVAEQAIGPAARASSVLLLVVIALVTLDARDELLRIGPAPIAAAATFAVACLAIGWFGNGGGTAVRRAAAIATAERSASVALLVALGLGDASTTGAVVAFGLVLLAVNASVAFALGRRPAPVWSASRDPA